MKNLFKASLFFCIALVLFSCESDEIAPLPPASGFEYFPLAVGKFVEYQIDSIVYDPINASAIVVDTTTSFLREEIVGAVESQTGDQLYQIERFERAADTLPWQIKNVWVAYRTDQEAIRQEENVRHLKMVFPLQADRTWDIFDYFPENTIISVEGETLEMYKGWNPTVVSLEAERTLANNNFDNLLEISLVDAENLIEKRFGVEQYAPNIGLVYRKLIILDTQQIVDGVSFEERAEKGFILEQKLIDFN